MRSRRRRAIAAACVAPIWMAAAVLAHAPRAPAATEDAPPGPETSPAHAASRGLWIDRDTLGSLPTEGPAWQALRRAARAPIDRPNLSDQDDPTNVRVLARAFVHARTGDAALRAEVVDALARIRGTESRATALSIGRELLAYVIAADLVALDGQARRDFETWLERIRHRRFAGRSLRTTHEDRPNNWGTHAGASRLAAALYLGDDAEVERAAHVFRGWCGERDGWRRFEFGRASWQPPFSFRRYAVNPPGARRRGRSIDGVLPDDQRRGGPFTWPPPKENYVWEALQGAVAQAVLLDRAGYDAWRWGDRALLRAFRWLHDEADFAAVGDDTWLPPIVNAAYGTAFPVTTPSRPGKGMGFGDWTHPPGARSGTTPAAP